MVRKYDFWIVLLVLACIISACGSPSDGGQSTPSTSATAGGASAVTTAVPALASSPADTSTPAAEATGQSAATDDPPLTVTDAAGREITLPAVPQRIISLAPNNTETLFALGAGPNVIAVDDFSDYPAEVTSLPRIGGNNAQYNIERIVELKPDLVLAAGITPQETLDKLYELKLPVVVASLTENSFKSINESMTLIGTLTGHDNEAARLNQEIQERIDAVASKTAGVSTKPRVFWELDATDPSKPYTVGPNSFINDLIQTAGGVNIFANADSPYPQVSQEQIIAANPEVIILIEGEYSAKPDAVAARPGWDTITAVQQKKLFYVDGNLVSRLGPRTVEGLEQVARILHPDLFK